MNKIKSCMRKNTKQKSVNPLGSDKRRLQHTTFNILMAFGTLNALSLVASPASAACITVSPNQIECTGTVINTPDGINLINSSTGATSITATGELTGTSGYGISAINDSSATDLSIEVAKVTGESDGISVINSGTGMTSITASGAVTGISADGIFAKNDVSSTNLIIDVARVTGGDIGINAENVGTGTTRITATGEVIGTNEGISANNESFATDLSINAARVTGGDIGINAQNFGTGGISITATGEVVGTKSYGIYAYNDSFTKDLTINVTTAIGGDVGIEAQNNGTGATSITATGEVRGVNDSIDAFGILAINGSSATDLIINAATATGDDGIITTNSGTGATSITTTGKVIGSSDGGFGIFANNIDTTTDLTIDVVAVTGYGGVFSENSGIGPTHIIVRGEVIGTGNHGIYAADTSSNAAELSVSVGAQGSVTGAASAIQAEHEGSGPVTVILLGRNSHIQGGTEAGVNMVTASGNQFLETAAQISSLNDLALKSTNVSGSTLVNNTGLMTGIIQMTGNAITFNNQTNGVLSLRDFSQGSKADPSSSFGGTVLFNNAGTAIFNNAGTIKFDAANDGSLTHATFSGLTLFVHSGSIDLTTQSPVSHTLSGNTLTLAGEFVSNGGHVYLNTLLDNGNSNNGIGTSDRLLLTNVTTGGAASKLHIQPTSDSLGALTIGNGIEVVNVSGNSSADAFTLGRALTVGEYEYVLNKGSADQNWYLSSFLASDLEHKEPLYNPAIGAYLANQSAAATLFMHSLYERQGQVSANTISGKNDTKSSLWVRALASKSRNQSINGMLGTKTDASLIHLGGDVVKWNKEGGDLHLGLMGAYGQTDSDVNSNETHTTASGKVTGYALGIYGTWFADETQAQGLYVDGWAQYGWYKNRVRGEAQVNHEEKYDSTNWATSIEAGYGMQLFRGSNTDLIFTPQVQITYNHYSADDHKDGNNLHVKSSDASGVLVRLGARLHGKAVKGYGARPYIEANWVHNTAKNELNFNGDVLKDQIPKDKGELKLGLQGMIAKNWKVWGQVGGQWGSKHYESYEGKIGVSYQW